VSEIGEEVVAVVDEDEEEDSAALICRWTSSGRSVASERGTGGAIEGAVAAAAAAAAVERADCGVGAAVRAVFIAAEGVVVAVEGEENRGIGADVRRCCDCCC